MGVITWNGSASTDYGTAANWSSGSVPSASSNVVIPDTSSINNCVLDQSRTVNSFRIDANGDFTGGGHTLTIDNEGDATTGTSEGYSARIEGIINSASDTNLNFVYGSGEALIKLAPTSGNVHDLTINKSGGDNHKFEGNTTLTGTFWIKDGSARMNGDSDTLTVTEDIRLGSGSDAGFFGHNDHDGAITARALWIEVGTSTFTSTEGVLTLNGELSDYVINNDGVFVHNSGTVTITTAATTRIDGAGVSGNQFYNLIINHASAVVEMYSDITVANNLTITAGQLTTGTSGFGFSNLTVAGTTRVDGTLTCNTSTVSLGSGKTDGYGLNVAGGGTFTGGSGTHTIGSCNLQSSTTFTSGTTTIDSAFSGYSLFMDTSISHGNGTVAFTSGADQKMGETGTDAPTRTFNNLIVNKSGGELTFVASNPITCAVAGDLTITAGEFDTGPDNVALTVAGNTVVTGTLTGNNSTLIFGTDGVHGSTESGALQVDSGGSLTFGSGDLTAFSGFTAKGTNTVTSTGGGDILIKGRTNNGFMNSHGHTGVNITGDYKILYDNNSLHDVRNNMAITAANIIYSVSNRTYDFWTTATDSTVTFTGNLQISNSTTTLNTQETGREPTQTFTVSGDTTLDGTLIGNSTEISTGSLTINSGGTYNATSGTTTITNKNSSNYMFFDAGTFTHNNGTVHFKADTSSGTWYAVKGHSTEDTTEFYNVTTERVGSSIGNYRVCVGGSNQFFTVRNNLTVGANCKIFSGNGSSILRQLGLATIDGELDLDNFTDIEMGAVTMNSGGTLEMDNGSITLKAESFRNVGGTINA